MIHSLTRLLADSLLRKLNAGNPDWGSQQEKGGSQSSPEIEENVVKTITILYTEQFSILYLLVFTVQYRMGRYLVLKKIGSCE